MYFLLCFCEVFCKYLLYSLNLWVFCLYVCTISTLCMPDIYRGQKRASHTLKLELRKVVSHLVYTGNWTGTVETQQALLTIESSLYPYMKPFISIFMSNKILFMKMDVFLLNFVPEFGAYVFRIIMST